MSNHCTIQLPISVTFLCWILMTGSQVRAQDSEREVMAPIHRMFEAMSKADTVLLQSAFHSDVTFTTIAVLPGGDLKLTREDGPRSFKRAIAKLQPDYLQEPIYDYKIFIADGFAQVWAPYALFAGGQFRHCGVDSFQLLRASDGWKIFHLADTRKKEKCNVPDHILKAYSR